MKPQRKTLKRLTAVTIGDAKGIDGRGAMRATEVTPAAAAARVDVRAVMHADHLGTDGTPVALRIGSERRRLLR